MKVNQIQILRALAAVLVVILHSINESFPISELAQRAKLYPHPERLWDSALEIGVDLFFVISGFVMVVASRKLFEAKGGQKEFLLKRFTRVVPPYWIATLLFFAIGRLASGAVRGGEETLSSLVKSLLFIPYAHPDGSMQPVYKLGWTLNYEIFFYVCFSFFLFLPRKRGVLWMTVLFGALSLFHILFNPERGALYYWTDPNALEFILGVWIGVLYLDGFRLPQGVGLGLMAFAVAVVASGVLPMVWNRFYFWGIPSALFLAGTVFSFRSEAFEKGLWPFATKLGDASYALYLGHPFLLRVMRQLWVKFGVYKHVTEYVFVAIALVLSCSFALLIYKYLEVPMTKWIQGKVFSGEKKARSAA